ncbi:MAG: ferrous iron transport protein B [Bacteroidota bacterium]
MSRKIRIALIGNPNSGKSTVFNDLTGLQQKVANFPGVTVEQKVGVFTSKDQNGETLIAEVVDLPGTYSLYPKSPEEELPFRLLCNPDHPLHPDVTVVVADGTNLKRNLFLCSQVVDLGIPVVLVMNMMDLVRKNGTVIDFKGLEEKLGISIVPMNARNQEGLDELVRVLSRPVNNPKRNQLDVVSLAPEVISLVRSELNVNSDYNSFLVANNLHVIDSFELSDEKRKEVIRVSNEFHFDATRLQALETLERYKVISDHLKLHVIEPLRPIQNSTSYKIDSLLTHRVWGYVIFLSVLFIIFQTIFTWAAYPMDLIDGAFNWLNSNVQSTLPPGILNDLVVGGILAGINGIVIFIPQIALLFFFIAILEDTGYMARVSFLMDRLMRGFGLNGKSLIPLMSGAACAVPALLSTRTIRNRKERMITLMVTPLMSCSARLPVYTLLVALVIPGERILGISLQGFVMMLLYIIGFVAALFAAWTMRYFFKSKERSFYVMELPVYRIPRWKTIIIHILEKVKIFLFDAGKVILAISIILWVLSSFAPGDTFDRIEKEHAVKLASTGSDANSLQSELQAKKLEGSYAGRLGHLIEPAIKPLGYDWKIGIALITSFAAREVFVGTMSTIYSVGDEENATSTLKEKLQNEMNPETGAPRYTLAVGLSLMLFYAFAMQCMSTLATVYRETQKWKYPVIQFVYMSGLAYLSALFAFQLLKP